MRSYFGVIVLCFLVILSSGSLIPQTKQVKNDSKQWVSIMEHLLAEEEKDLEAYRQDLQEAGEELFAEQQAQLRRAQEQELHNAARRLKDEMEGEAKSRQEELNKEILNHQLQLVLVSLEQDQKLDKLNQIARLQNKLEQEQEQAQLDLKIGLEQLRTKHEAIAILESQRLQVDLEKAMADDFAQYRQARLQSLEREMSNLTAESRNALLNR